MELRSNAFAPAGEPAVGRTRERAPHRMAGAMARRTIAGALERGGDADAAVARFVRRARADELPVAEMVDGVRRILDERFRTRATDEDRDHAVAAVVSRALARYYRDD